MKRTHGKEATMLGILIMAVIGGAAPQVHAVSCNGGATVRIVVNNPTGSTISSGVSISGASINGLTTCTDQSNSYSQSNITLNSGNNTFTFSGLNMGMWVHTITVDVGSNDYSQYQKGVILKAPDSGGNPYSQADWIYYANSRVVNTTGDSGSGTCTTSCTLRQAINSVNNIVTSSSNRAIIVLTASPGTMSSGTLSITRPYVTIDGTSSGGNPWVVGDTLSSQDSFPVTIDLADVTHFEIDDTNIIFKGLEIKNTKSGTPQSLLIEDTANAADFRLDSTRIDGGAATETSCPTGCEDGDMIQFFDADVTMKNIEARNAYGSGFYSGPGLIPTIDDSWFHNNLFDNVDVEAGALSRNLIELGGFNGSDPNNPIESFVKGIYGQGGSDIQTDANLVRNNSGNGFDVTAVSTYNLSLGNDYVCGNDDDGIYVSGSSSGNATGTGIASAYNMGNGIEFDSLITGGTMDFDDSSAYTANSSAGFKNSSSYITVSATNNQWRDVTGASIGNCGPSSDTDGNITCSPAQDYKTVTVNVDPNDPTTPSNVLRTSQAIRIKGTGFNAIDGNPLYTAPNPDCNRGADGTSNNCCRLNSKANTCSGSPPDGVVGAGNCVAIKDRAGTWNTTSPSAVTPSSITVGLPGSIACFGQTSELVRVSKRDDSSNIIRDDESYCTNVNPK